MSSEDQDLIQSLAPLTLTHLSPPDAVSLPPSAWRGLSQHDASQQSLSQSAPMFFVDSQLDNMGQAVGLQLPAPPELVIPPQTSTFPIQTTQAGPNLGRIPTAQLTGFQHNFVIDGGTTMLGAPIRHPSVCKAEHKNSKAARRGPMDEMRQLVRILVKLMPESSHFLTVPDEGGGGNRVKEEYIKDYLNKVLGRSHDLSDESPPYPEWGLGNGWAAYLSQLFTWATGAPISSDQALRCARRLPGRSWETLNEELEKLRLCPSAWPLPLRREAVRDIQKKYQETGQMPAPLPRVMQLTAPMPAALLPLETGAPLATTASGAVTALPPDVALPAQPTAKRPAANGVGDAIGQPGHQLAPGIATNQSAYGFVQPMYAVAAPPSANAPLSYYQGAPGPAVKRRRKAGLNGIDLSSLADLSELELWHIVLHVLQEAETKRNTTPSDKLGDLQFTHDMVRRVVDNFAPMGGVAAGYQPQLNQGGGPALGAPSQPAGALPTAASMDAQLKRLVSLNNMALLQQGAAAGPQGEQLMQVLAGQGLVGAGWSKVPAQQQQSVAGATPGGPQGQQLADGAVQVSGQVSGAPLQAPQASHATVQQAPALSQHTQAQTVPPAAQQPQHQQPQSHQSHPHIMSHAGGVQGVGGAAPSGIGSTGIVKPSVVQDLLHLKAQSGKEAGKEAAGKQGEIRLGSSSGAFKSYDKGVGGLDALVAAAAKLGDKCGGEPEDEEAGGQVPSPPTATQAPPLSQQHRNGADNAATRGGSGPAVPRHTAEHRKAEGKAVGRSSAASAAAEEVDETETKGLSLSLPANVPAESAEVDGPTGPQPASSSAPPRNATSELRTRVHLQLDQAVQDVEERRTQQPQAQQPPAPSAAAPSVSAPASTEAGGLAVSAGTQALGACSPTSGGVNVSQQHQPYFLMSPAMQVSGLYATSMDGLTTLAHRAVGPSVLQMPYAQQLGLPQPLLFVAPGQVGGQSFVFATQQTATLGPGVQIGMPTPSVVQPQ